MLLILFSLQAVSVLWWIYLQTLPIHTTIWNFLYNGVYGLVFLLGGLTGLFYGMKLGGLKSSVGRATTFIAAGLTFYGIGQFMWVYYNLHTNNNIPYPSPADFLFTASMVLYGIGFWYLLRMYRALLTRRLALELAGALIITWGIILLFIGPPDFNETNMIARTLNFVYPFGDAVLVSLAFVTFRTGGGKVDKSILAFVGGMILLATADTLFTYRNNMGIYWNGDITDLLFSLSGFMLSWGVIRTINSFVKVNTK